MEYETPDETVHVESDLLIDREKFREFSICEPSWHGDAHIQLRQHLRDLKAGNFSHIAHVLRFYISKDDCLYNTNEYCFVYFCVRNFPFSKTKNYCTNIPYNKKREEYLGGHKYDRDSDGYYVRSLGILSPTMKKDSAHFSISLSTSVIESISVITRIRYQTETMLFVCKKLGIKLKRHLF